VDGEKGSASLRGGANGSCNGVGDVVEFEIKEDVEAAVANLLDDAVASRVVEFHADLVPVAGLAEEVDEGEGLGCVRVVEGYGKAKPGVAGDFEVVEGFDDGVLCGGHGFSLAVLDGYWRVRFGLSPRHDALKLLFGPNKKEFRENQNKNYDRRLWTWGSQARGLAGLRVPLSPISVGEWRSLLLGST
jgi:hypothetical protein